MALSQMQRSGTISEEKLNLPRNTFNLSCGKYLEFSMGMCVPFDVIRMVPGDTANVEYNIKIESKMPTIVPIKNNMRVFVKTYFATDSMLWAGAHNHISKGVRQDQDLPMPKYLPYYEENATVWSTTGKKWMTITPNCPLNYMGVPWFGYNEKAGNKVQSSGIGTETVPKERRWSFQPCLWKSGSNVDNTYVEKIKYTDETATRTEINALPLVMYVKIKRKDFVDANLLMKNKKWFPDEEDHFRLPYNVTKNNYGPSNSSTKGYVNCLDWEKPLRTENELGFRTRITDEDTDLTNTNQLIFNIPKNEADDVPVLNTMYFVPRRRDYYWGSSPFADLIRTGTQIPTLNMEGMGQVKSNEAVSTAQTGELMYLQYDTNNRTVYANNANNYNNIIQTLNKLKVDNSNVSFNVMQIRNVIAETLVIERIGLIHNTDFYNGYMQSIYGENPNSESGDPIYVGGFYNDIIMDTVQNLADTGESPVGFKNAIAQGVVHGNIGKFTCNEFGWLMSVMYIVPDTIYTNGLEKMWKIITQKEQYNPLLQQTSPDKICKYEVGLPQESPTEWNNTEKAFGYTKKDEYLKWRTNKIIGFCEYNKPDKYILDQAYFIKTNLSTNQAALNEMNLEVHHENTICTAFADMTDYQFKADIGCNITMARNMMKEAKPASFGVL